MLDVQDRFPSYPKNGIYLDSATIGLQVDQAIIAQSEFLNTYSATINKSFHKRSRSAFELYAETKVRLGSYFGWSDKNYSFVPNGDYAWNLIFHQLIMRDDRPKILASIFDHHSLISPLIDLNRRKLIELSFLSARSNDELLVEIQEKIPNHDYLCLNSVSPSLAINRAIPKISRIVHNNGKELYVDYSRNCVQNNLILEKDNPDIAVIDSSLDLLGPQMLGLLIMKESIFGDRSPPFLGSGNVNSVTKDQVFATKDISKFEMGNPNMPAIAGLLADLAFLSQVGKMKIHQHANTFQKQLRKALAEIPDLRSITPISSSTSNIITFVIDGINSHDFVLMMDESENIELRSGLLCTHIGMDAIGKTELIQLSSHIYNTMAEIDGIIASITKTIKVLQ